MKKLLAILLAMVMVMSLFAACGGSEENTDDEKETKGEVNKDDDDQTESKDTEDTEETEDEETEPSTNKDVAVYKVTVVDEDGNPVEGAGIQFCDADGCSVPVLSQLDGVATCQTFRRDDKVAKVLDMPEGYEYATEQTEFTFDENDEATIVLKPIETEDNSEELPEETVDEVTED